MDPLFCDHPAKRATCRLRGGARVPEHGDPSPTYLRFYPPWRGHHGSSGSTSRPYLKERTAVTGSTAATGITSRAPPGRTSAMGSTSRAQRRKASSPVQRRLQGPVASSMASGSTSRAPGSTSRAQQRLQWPVASSPGASPGLALGIAAAGVAG